MRGKFSQNGEVQADIDTSSSGSSPHSHNDDDIIEVTNLNFNPKPIYNFSIPDLIKHEPHIESNVQRKRSSRDLLKNDTSDDNYEKGSKRRAISNNVIDLTEVDSHDESGVASDSEITFSNELSRSLNHDDSENSFINVLSDLEQFRHRLEQSRERMHFMRPNLLHRLRRRRSSRAVVTDGPLITSNMLDTRNNVIPETISDDSVLVVDDQHDDHEIALRMATDPNFSPPYYAISTEDSSRHPVTALRDADSSHFQEQYYAIHQRNREQIEQACRINQQTRERLERIHYSISTLRYSNIRNRSSRVRRRDESLADNARRNLEEQEVNSTDVEFVREMRPRNLDYLHTSLNDPIYPRTLLSRNLVSNDFLMDSIWGRVPPPRLHHFQTEDFEALWDLTERIGPAKLRGLSKTELDTIPSFRFSTGTAKETNSKCVVCMSEYVNREKLRRLPCTHDFHSKCIDKWLRSNRTCPVCRDDVKTANQSE
ncbi:uncharacterized protein LOC100210297 isoform X2 [Hydra vulgaris]|uniref:Uncharacterized protein LOC100210297 isoform X2 n=1 Tax=Hydra vulgaris TaxID=6087 RepID=A0ABM4BDN1_HYDVU